MKKINFTILDPMGNITALVETRIPKSRRSLVVKKIMSNYPTVEQVGFIKNDKLEMMGTELSINGTLAAGYFLSKKYGQQKLEFKINLTSNFIRSGLAETPRKSSGARPLLLKFSLIKKLSTILLTIPYKIVKIDGFDFVDLGGIGYFVIDSGQARMTKRLLRYARNDEFLQAFEKFRKKFEKTLNRNAWGVIFYKDNRIWPVVYVKDSRGKTLEKRLEMACGSGSLAYYLISGQEKIIQPSGKVIRIKKKKDKFEISGKVKIIASQDVVL